MFSLLKSLFKKKEYMLMNRIYNFNRWLDNNEGIKVLILLISVGAFSLMSIFSSLLFISIIGISMISIFAVIRVKISDGFIKFDKTNYVLPEAGEIILVKKDIHTLSYIGEYILKGKEYKIMRIDEKDDDWILKICEIDNRFSQYRISYMQHRKNFDTKSDLIINNRNKKLEKLLK